MPAKKQCINKAEEYVQWTDDNLKARDNFFSSLNIDEIAGELVQLSKPERRHVVEHVTKNKPKPKSEKAEPRRSLRLQNKLPTSMNENELAVTENEPAEVLKRRILASQEFIDLRKCVREDRTTEENVAAVESLFQNLPKTDCGTENELAGRTSSDINISSLVVAKVCKDRAFSLAIHPQSSRLIIAAGDSSGSVGIFSESDTPVMGEFQPHDDRAVPGLVFDACHLLSTSFDGTLRSLDLNRTDMKFQLLYDTDDFPGVTSVWIPPNRCYKNSDYWLSRTDGHLVHMDGRTDEFIDIYHVARHCRTVSVCPEKHYLCCAGREGVMTFLDSRHMSKPLATANHAGSISSAYFNPHDPSLVLSTSHDNTVRISRFNGNDCKVELSLSHNNKTGRFLTPFRAIWHPQDEFMFGIGSLQRPRQVQIFTSSANKFPRFSCQNLYHDLLASVQSLVAFHRCLPIMVGINSSGRAHIMKLK